MNAVFPIIGKLLNVTNQYMILATGFFIDENGIFITAGHTFRKNQKTINQFYICFPNKGETKLIPITSYKWLSKQVYGEVERRDRIKRDRRKYQCGPEFTDLAVGSVSLENTPFFQFQKKKPYKWERLYALCYNRNPNTCPNIKFSLQTNKIESSFFEYEDKSFLLRNRMKFARVYYMGETFDYENIDMFNNCIEAEGQSSKGNSGAPVINDKGKVIGILLGGEEHSPTIIHLSRYISKKSKVLRKQI